MNEKSQHFSSGLIYRCQIHRHNRLCDPSDFGPGIPAIYVYRWLSCTLLYRHAYTVFMKTENRGGSWMNFHTIHIGVHFILLYCIVNINANHWSFGFYFLYYRSSSHTLDSSPFIDGAFSHCLLALQRYNTKSTHTNTRACQTLSSISVFFFIFFILCNIPAKIYNIHTPDFIFPHVCNDFNIKRFSLLYYHYLLYDIVNDISKTRF